MTADVFLLAADGTSVAEFYGLESGQRIRVKRGQKLSIHLVDDMTGLEWGTTSDPVLKVEGATDITVSTEADGTSKVFLLNAAWSAVFHINIEVFSAEAQSFKMPASTTEPV